MAPENGLTIVNNAKRLPSYGSNFQTYSRALSLIGRTHVHSRLRPVLLESFHLLESREPQRTWVYAETGWKNGGNFWPHRTHRNGLCVDFIVPVIDKETSDPTMLPLGIFNGYGYRLRFDADGIYKNYQIDFRSIILHLRALNETCGRHGLRIKRVILDPPLLSNLKNNAKYSLVANISFMEKHAWFPHDSHYHVDFEIMR